MKGVTGDTREFRPTAARGEFHRRANEEEGRRGRFFEQRFYSEALLGDEVARTATDSKPTPSTRGAAALRWVLAHIGLVV